MESPIITAVALTKYYGKSKKPSLDNINLTIFKGEKFGVLGPNGAGKTTLISLLCNIIKATSGTIEYTFDNQEKNIKSESLLTELKNNWKLVLNVILLNWGMLLSGYLGEREVFSHVATTIVGFMPFLLMFYIIYKNFAMHTSQGQKIFWYFSGIWAIYGIAAVLPYKIKNSMYNILDLFAKNFFGLFLAYLIYNARK
jgi:ABC-type multidrug transport system fused ATPase/permease subunit